MFDGGKYNMVLPLLFLRVRCAVDCPVVAFRAAWGKINFVGLRAQKLRNFIAREIDGVHCRSAKRVGRIGVAVIRREIREHFFKYFFVQRRGCRVVEIDAFHGFVLDFIRSYYSEFEGFCQGYTARRERKEVLTTKNGKKIEKIGNFFQKPPWKMWKNII